MYKPELTQPRQVVKHMINGEQVVYIALDRTQRPFEIHFQSTSKTVHIAYEQISKYDSIVVLSSGDIIPAVSRDRCPILLDPKDLGVMEEAHNDLSILELLAQYLPYTNILTILPEYVTDKMCYIVPEKRAIKDIIAGIPFTGNTSYPTNNLYHQYVNLTTDEQLEVKISNLHKLKDRYDPIDNPSIFLNAMIDVGPDAINDLDIFELYLLFVYLDMAISYTQEEFSRLTDDYVPLVRYTSLDIRGTYTIDGFIKYLNMLYDTLRLSRHDATDKLTKILLDVLHGHEVVIFQPAGEGVPSVVNQSLVFFQNKRIELVAYSSNVHYQIVTSNNNRLVLNIRNCSTLYEGQHTVLTHKLFKTILDHFICFLPDSDNQFYLRFSNPPQDPKINLIDTSKLDEHVQQMLFITGHSQRHLYSLFGLDANVPIPELYNRVKCIVKISYLLNSNNEDDQLAKKIIFDKLGLNKPKELDHYVEEYPMEKRIELARSLYRVLHRILYSETLNKDL